LIYLDTGSLEFDKIVPALSSADYSAPLLFTGFGMMMVGIGFKLALVPFHMWTPDVYQGAPVPVTTYIATVSKGAVMALLLRFFFAIRGFQNPGFILIITILAILSMFVGNLLALRQQNIKRILAYSSIANMGYLLVTLLIGNETGIHAAIFYIVSYIITSLGAFGVITLLSNRQNDADKVENYKGLFWTPMGCYCIYTLFTFTGRNTFNNRVHSKILYRVHRDKFRPVAACDQPDHKQCDRVVLLSPGYNRAFFDCQ
jgi:NADH-quinone oxidoreductase subunit N